VILAIVGERMLRWAAMGDSLLATVHSSTRVAFLGQRKSHFVGWPMTRDELADRLQRGLQPIADGSWVILATDGLADFVDDLEGVLRSATGDEPDASLAVERLIEAAFAGGAGDNVAVAALHVACRTRTHS
jgi:serine/threonine protein phosphatase PrpC